MYDNDTGSYTKKADVNDALSYKVTGLTKGARYRFKIAAVRTTDIKNYLSAQSKKYFRCDYGSAVLPENFV